MSPGKLRAVAPAAKEPFCSSSVEMWRSVTRVTATRFCPSATRRSGRATQCCWRLMGGVWAPRAAPLLSWTSGDRLPGPRPCFRINGGGDTCPGLGLAWVARL